MADQWVVLLEAAGNATSGPIDAGDLRRLHDALGGGPHGAVLHSSDRYALQVTATAAGPVDALLDVVARWADAVRRLGLPAWKLVRTEVFTPEDLEREFETAQRQEIGDHLPKADPGYEEHDEIGHELLRRAFSDPLTGLLGRQAFTHRLEAVLDGRRAVAVVSLDLDGFEGVNHRFGRAVGDEVLVTLAQRLAAMVRPQDTLGRLGGDEYGILLEDTTAEAALAVAQRMLGAIRRPMSISGHELTLSASIGVAVSQPGDDAQALVPNAESALALAKQEGGGRQVLYRSTMSPTPTGSPAVEAPQDRFVHLLLTQEAAVAANEADTLEEAAEAVMRQICSQVGCAIGHLWVSPEHTSSTLSPSVWHMADANDYGRFQEASEKLSFAPSVGLPGRVLASGVPVWITDLAADPSWLRRQEALEAGLESGCAFPVLIGREVVAVVEFFFRTRTDASGSFLDVLAGIGTQLGRVVERQRAAEALRRATEQLRASEARLREAQHMARLESWQFDLRTGERVWSEGMYALFGLEPGQPLDFGAVLATVHPDDRSRAQAVLARLMSTGEPTAEEFRVLRPDGEVRWHRAQGSAIRDDNGVVVAIQGISQDITDAKMAHEALRERERQLNEAQRAARLGCWEIELSSGRLTWSKEMYRLWGWDPGQEISLDAFLATVHPDDRQRLLEAGARLEQTGETSFVDFRATVADGHQRWFRGEAHMLFDEAGRAVKLFGTDQDITEQKQAEEELQRAKDLYQRIVETTREGIVIVDAGDIITFVNPRMAEILGYSVDTMTGMPASSLVDEETRARLSGQQKRRRQGMSEHYETQLLTKDGAVLHVLVSASPFVDVDGHYTGALALVTDVTTLREAEEIVRSQTAEIQTGVDEEGRDEQAAT